MNSILSMAFLVSINMVELTHGKIDRTTYARDDQVLVLDDWNYKNIVKNINFIFTVCYEKGRDGKVALEEFQKAKEVLINECEDLDFARIDMSKYGEFRRDYPILITPCIRLFKKNKFFDYHGEIVAKHIITWAHQAMNMPLDIKVSKELEELKKTTSVILGVFPNKSPNQEYQQFIEASENFVYDPKIELPRFAVITTQSRVLRELGVSQGQVIIYKKFQHGEKVVFQGNGRDGAALQKFLDDESYPYVHKHDFKGLHKKVNSLEARYRHVLFMDSADPTFKATYNSYRDAAKTYSAKSKDVLFVYADPKEVPEDTMIGYFHIDLARDLPCNRIIMRDRFNSKFRPGRVDLSYRGFIQFTDDVVGGRIKRSIKSEVQPSDWDRTEVKYLVGTTYESFIFQNKQKSVFILYYGPGEQKSDEVAAEFEKAAYDMRNDQTVVCAKLDVVQNDGEIGSELAYPSLVLHFPGGQRSKTYNGNEFKAEAFIRFVTSGGTSTPPDAYERMMVDIEEDMAKAQAQLEADLIKADEERAAQWEQDEKEALEKSLVREYGQTMDELPEHIKYEREHGENPLEHDPEEHVNAAIGHYEF